MSVPSIKLNYICNSLNVILGMLFPIATFPYVARVLTPQGIGMVSFAASVVTYFIIIAQMGIPMYGIRECAKVRDNKNALDKLIMELFTINLIMTVFGYLLLIGAVLLVDKLYVIKKLMFVLSLSLCLTPFGLEWCYKGLEKYQYITIRNALFKLMGLVCIFFLIKNESDFIRYAGILVFVNSGYYICNFYNLRAHISFRKSVGYQFKKHLKPILTLLSMSIAINIYVILPVTMIGLLQNSYSVGLFAAAQKINMVVLALITSLGTVLLPRLSYHIEHGDFDSFSHLIRRSLDFIVFLACPIIFFILFNTKEILLFICGKEFITAANCLRIMTPILLLVGISNITGIQVLLPLNQERKLTWSVVFGAFFGFILYIWLIPLLGYNGAAISAVCSEIVVLGIQLIFIRKSYRVKLPIATMMKYLALSALCAGSCMPLKYMHLAEIYYLPLSSFAFSIIYVSLLLLQKDRVACYFLATIYNLRSRELKYALQQPKA